LETSKTESSPSFNIPPPKLKRKEQTSKQKSFYIETFKEKLSLGADKAYDYHQNTKKESFSATYLRQALPDMWEINKNKAIQMALNDIESFDDLLKKKEIVRNAISGILSRFDVDGVTEFVRELLKNLPNTHRSLVSDRQQYFGEKLVWNQEDTLLVAVSVLKGKETDEMDIKKKNVRKVIKFAKDIKPNFDVFPEEFIGQVKSLLENRGLDKDVEGFMSWANPQQKTESH
jgi:hypothetical protein